METWSAIHSNLYFELPAHSVPPREGEVAAVVLQIYLEGNEKAALTLPGPLNLPNMPAIMLLVNRNQVCLLFYWQATQAGRDVPQDVRDYVGVIWRKI